MSGDHRKIYEHYHGPIPEAYDVHHIDGNHANNHPANLQALPKRKHYNIHYKQGDFGACHAIAMRMKISPKEFSALCSKSQKIEQQRRIKNGTHNFLGDGSFQRNVALKRIAKGTHNFLGLSRRRVENGTHNFLIEHTCVICGKTGKGARFQSHHLIKQKCREEKK